ncbi:MAG: hypothetical protein Q4B48_06910 [Syntrophomonadaceae bacterium]|nr:hypothetical protein [Syntrophomonadaceae bacterium]
MKKILALAMALIMVFALAACGGDTDPAPSGGDTPTNSQQPEQTPSTPSESTPEQSSGEAEEPTGDYTVAEFLTYYGMTEDDIMPEYFVEFAPVEMEGDSKAGEIDSFGYIKINVDKDATTQEDINAWFETLYAKMLSLSTDGKLHKYPQYIGTEDDKEASLQSLMEGPLWADLPGGSCAYPYKLSTGDAKIMVASRYDIEAGQYSLSISVWR